MRLALPGVAEGVACDGGPPLPTVAAQYAEAGGRLLVCPICFGARQIGGATRLWQWIGDGATVFSY